MWLLLSIGEIKEGVQSPVEENGWVNHGANEEGARSTDAFTSSRADSGRTSRGSITRRGESASLRTVNVRSRSRSSKYLSNYLSSLHRLRRTKELKREYTEQYTFIHQHICFIWGARPQLDFHLLSSAGWDYTAVCTVQYSTVWVSSI